MDINSRLDTFAKSIELGIYLKELRSKIKISLAELGTELDVSANYLSEIERGIKLPSDELLVKYANYFNIKEEVLFDILDRVPKKIYDEIQRIEELRMLLLFMINNLSDEERSKKYKEFYQMIRKE